MFANPPRAIHAAKVALAVVLVYWLTLQWGWMKPLWAGFAVIFCSLMSQGESLNKSALRLWGTVIGGIAVFVIIALFSQDRWLLLSAVCVYLGVVVYLMTGSKDNYMWQVSCFVVLAVLPAASGDPAYIFQTGVERMLETTLGCCVWALIDMLIVPVTNSAKLGRTATELAGAQEKLFSWCREQSQRVDDQPADHGDYAILRAQQLKLLEELDKALAAAGAESHEVRERRAEWSEFVDGSRSLALAFDQWQSGLGELVRIDMTAAVRGFSELAAAAGDVLADSSALWDGGDARSVVESTRPELEAGDLAALSNFDQAAVLVSAENLKEAAALVQRLNRSARLLNDQPAVESAPAPAAKAPELLVPVLDPDRLRAVAFIITLVVGCFLLWVWFDPPGHASIWTVTAIFGTIAASLPHVRIGSILFKVFALVLPVSALIYIFIMPALSSFAELAVLMLVYFFAVQYWLKNPLAVMLASAGFLIMTGIGNEQSYSFVGVAVSYLFILLASMLLVTGSYVLGTPRPEKRLLGMLGRYFRSANYLLHTMAEPDRERRGPVAEWLSQFHEREVTTLPKKMRMWASQIDRVNYPANTPEQVAAMVDGLVGLNYRLRELLLVRDVPHSPELTRQLGAAVADWRAAIQGVFSQIVSDTEQRPDVAQLREQLDARMHAIEELLTQILESDAGAQLGSAEQANAYRVLGGYRGVSIAALSWLEHAVRMDFDDWRRESFS